MKITDKIIKYRIEPYINESILQLALDLFVILLITIVFIIVDFSVTAVILVDLAYLIIALFLHYRVTIQAIIDKKKNDFITETFCIKQKQFNEEYSFTGDRLGHSHIRLFYPKEMHVCKYKFKIINDKGEEKKLRAVMSFKRTLKFIVFNENEIEYLNVTYLKRSRIIISFDLVEDIDKIASNRKKEEIKKAINYINFFV